MMLKKHVHMYVILRPGLTSWDKDLEKKTTTSAQFFLARGLHWVENLAVGSEKGVQSVREGKEGSHTRAAN